MSNMKVFISWSGDVSKLIAERISEWLKHTLMTVEPVFTPNSIVAGSRGRDKLYTILEEVYTGILVYTPESLQSQWIIFEAGAMHGNAANSIIIPLMFNLSYSELPDPLKDFQFKEFNKNDMLQVLEAVNAQRGEQQVEHAILKRAFDREWEELERDIKAALLQLKPQKPTDEQDIMKKVLEMTEAIAVGQKELITQLHVDEQASHFIIPPLTVEEMVRKFGLLVDRIIETGQYSLLTTLEELGQPLYFVTRKMFREESRVVREMQAHRLKVREWLSS